MHCNLVKVIIIFFTLLISNSLQAQVHTLYAVHSKWDDAFKEWLIETSDEEVTGELNMRWAFRDDFTEWDFTLGDERGAIKLKFPQGLQQWEVRIGNEVATIQQLWNGDLRQWRITDNNIKLTYKTKWGNNPFDWQLRDDKYGKFQMYTEYEADPRDWVIVDELDTEVGNAMKMGMMFITLIQVMPR